MRLFGQLRERQVLAGILVDIPGQRLHQLSGAVMEAAQLATLARPQALTLRRGRIREESDILWSGLARPARGPAIHARSDDSIDKHAVITFVTRGDRMSHGRFVGHLELGYRGIVHGTAPVSMMEPILCRAPARRTPILAGSLNDDR